MSKAAVGFLIAVVVFGNVVTIGLILGGRGSGSPGGGQAVELDASLEPLASSVDALRRDVERLSSDLAARPAPSAGEAATPAGGSAGPSADAAGVADQFDDVVERLDRLEKTLLEMKNVNDELVLAKLREKRQEQFRGDDGNMVADELLAEKKYALGANGILTFLEAHPDHPDARDLMRKARDAFRNAGYGEKALWMQNEILKRFPENRGSDLYGLAMLEKKYRKLDDALAHMEESVELARTDAERAFRMSYHAFLIHQRDGDQAGLQAYREVARIAATAGLENPGNEATKRADEIEQRLADGR